ncbi:hypothetical protein T492DRAFT_840768 [Pavlovales sp. CCMP2436]|nr:hypothetical protein T492DRAFT_840768 [Pavlovales sp. CCMP2436]
MAAFAIMLLRDEDNVPSHLTLHALCGNDSHTAGIQLVDGRLVLDAGRWLNTGKFKTVHLARAEMAFAAVRALEGNTDRQSIILLGPSQEICRRNAGTHCRLVGISLCGAEDLVIAYLQW